MGYPPHFGKNLSQAPGPPGGAESPLPCQCCHRSILTGIRSTGWFTVDRAALQRFHSARSRAVGVPTELRSFHASQAAILSAKRPLTVPERPTPVVDRRKPVFLGPADRPPLT